ncbi:MAG: zinc ribbon domain-containing protein [Oliverpabstia sp.]
MGGFTVNGCGTGDSFYPKLILGNHYCKYCKSIQEFDLMEVKRKIKVLYIPTVSINTKYAVACKKCKNGYYVEDSIRDDLLYGRKTIEVKEGEISYIDVAKVAKGISGKKESVSNEVKAVSTGSSVSFCPYCGNKIQPNQLFCTSCGKKVK